MLAVSHRSFEALPTHLQGDMDESGTINPAALNASCKCYSLMTRTRMPNAVSSYQAMLLLAPGLSAADP